MTKYSRTMDRRTLLRGAALASVAALTGQSMGLGTGTGKGSMERFKRCIVLGMDGLDPGVVSGLMKDGRLPNFTRLANEGTFRQLATSNPSMSPVAWTSIATGAGPGCHGIFDFIRRNPKDYRPDVAIRKGKTGIAGTSYEVVRQCDAFWTCTSRAGIPTTVIRWPVTFPPEKVDGRFLSGLGVPDLLGSEDQHAYYTTEAVRSDDPRPDNVLKVAWDEAGVIRTVLKGPYTGRDRQVEAPMVVRKAGPGGVTVELAGGAPMKVVCGEWTPWIRLSFKVLFQRIAGMTRFLLVEAEPHLRLFAYPCIVDPSDPAFPIAYPGDFAGQLAGRIGAFNTLGMPELTHPVSDRRYGFDGFLSQVEGVYKERRAMFFDELGRLDQGLLAFVFDHTDRIQHMLWATRDAGHPGYDKACADAYGHVIQETYQAMDLCLGEALKHADEKTLVLAVSDHGFGSLRRQVHLNRWLVDQGYMRLKGSQDSECQGLFLDVDWEKTKAYALGFTSLYVNTAGREAAGTVRGQEQSQELCREIASRIEAWVDTGHKVIEKVFLGRQIYGAGPLTASGPDMIMGYGLGYRASWQTAIGGVPTRLVEDNKSAWSGDHIFDPRLVPGILLANARIPAHEPRGIDVAPTILAALGVPRPSHMQGEPMLGA